MRNLGYRSLHEVASLNMEAHKGSFQKYHKRGDVKNCDQVFWGVKDISSRFAGGQQTFLKNKQIWEGGVIPLIMFHDIVEGGSINIRI